MPLSFIQKTAVVLFAIGAFVITAKMFAEDVTPYNPPLPKASNEGTLAIKKFQVPKGMTTSLFAAEPMLANPVSFCIDAKGRFYVAETFRQKNHKGVGDNRGHMYWLHDDLAAQHVKDREAMYRKYHSEIISKYTQHHDRIRMLEDTNNDGKADKATVYADGFNTILTGTGAGLLAHKGDVYYTCIPDLWKLRDTDNDGKANKRESLSFGYGVRVAFRGHDMHGLKMGPDGRIYFSIGDRGYNVITKEGKRLHKAYTGAVFRCEPDGSHLEEFAYGLRNPQELAFDNYGNLFSCDNNSDSGDKARWVYIVEGGDSGWRMYYQYLEDRGPFNREKIWHPKHTGQPAYIVPPIVNISDGPAGLVAYPGVGLSKRYKDHFFLCDFRGTPTKSGIRSFGIKPKGASFELVDSHQFIWQSLITDVDFGYDGSIYATDWVSGWDGLGKGRIYKFTDTEAVKNPAIAQTQKLMKQGMGDLALEKVFQLLDHPDKRIRLNAQFELVNKGRIENFQIVIALSKAPLFPKLHSVWGLGQLLRQKKMENNKWQETLRWLNEQSNTMEPQIRIQVLRVLGDVISRHRKSLNKELQTTLRKSFITRLADDHAHVQYHAAIALGKLGDAKAVNALLELLEKNNNEDAVIRHGCVMGLVGIGDQQKLISLKKHYSPAVRMAAVLAMRRLKMPEISKFLADADPLIVMEAARAIHDEPITAAFPKLAAMSTEQKMSSPLLRRFLNANFRLGGKENAEQIIKIIANKKHPEVIRLEALEELINWKTPPSIDRVLGDWRPLEARDDSFITALLKTNLVTLLNEKGKVQQAAIRLAALYPVPEAGGLIAKLVENKSLAAPSRVASLAALHDINYPQLQDSVAVAIKSKQPLLRAEARRILALHNPVDATKELKIALNNGTNVEKQSAIAVLSDIKLKAADDLLLDWLDKLVARKVPAEIQLDLISVAEKRKATAAFQQRLTAYNKTRSTTDHLAQFRESLAGGNAERGKNIFFGRTDATCRRCHKVKDSGGDVGPDLSHIAKDKNREYLLEALVLPNKKIAKGFETVVLAMLDGKVHIGVLKHEDKTTIKIMTATGEEITFNKEDIDERNTGKSAMPEDLVKKLSKADLRDLVEYLSEQK